jgi:hypothetical protein
MNSDDRTFSLNEIRAQHEAAERQAALMQRRAEALRKLTEAAEELELIESQMASPDAAPAPEAVPATRAVASPEPEKTGDRARFILRDRAGQEFTPREMKDEMVARGWSEDTEDARAAIRVALARLARRDPHVERAESGHTHVYRWISDDHGTVRRP